MGRNQKNRQQKCVFQVPVNRVNKQKDKRSKPVTSRLKRINAKDSIQKLDENLVNLRKTINSTTKTSQEQELVSSKTIVAVPQPDMDQTLNDLAKMCQLGKKEK
ncbi:uncharacterized protein LOC106460627 [Limulus polyphemus]|uniref:Uncharacterized protein LOC106460627 n=1 Tax=Limulus polyphemus TaxID=6850 RepID=A0ABM1B6I5_LIMPO|nr:uncharacterized protein LOC106460627 [Limulus polyphemus]XP_013775807.1 uncharacterized protein LOC106460627 [Limulus polyphemus]